MQITIIKVMKLKPCAQRLAMEARGLFGFHDSVACPECKFSLWCYQAHLGDSFTSPLISNAYLDPEQAETILRKQYPQADIKQSANHLTYLDY